MFIFIKLYNYVKINNKIHMYTQINLKSYLNNSGF